MKRPVRPLQRSEAIVFPLAAILFTSAAVWLSMIPISIGTRAIKLRNAVLVDARILNIDKQWVSSGDGSREAIFIRYEYDYLGERYEYNTENIALFGSNEVARQLEEDLAAGNAVQCFVDPDDPSLSIFSKEFSIGWFIFIILFASAFGGASVLLWVNLYWQTCETFRVKRLIQGNTK